MNSCPSYCPDSLTGSSLSNSPPPSEPLHTSTKHSSLRWNDHMTCVSESFRGLTLPVKQIEMDGLVLAEGAEGHHVLMRVESYSSKRRCTAQLRVHSDLVTCTTDIPVQSPLGFFFVFILKWLSPNLSQSSTHTPVHLHCLKRWSFRREWMCCWFAPCSLWHRCISSLQDWKTSVSFYLIFAFILFIWVLPYNYRYYQQMHWFMGFLKSQHGSKIGSNYF